jgi:hypothetical protein
LDSRRRDKIIGLTLSLTQPPAILHVVEIPFSFCRYSAQLFNRLQSLSSVSVRLISSCCGAAMRGKPVFLRDMSRDIVVVENLDALVNDDTTDSLIMYNRDDDSEVCTCRALLDDRLFREMTQLSLTKF